MLFLRVYQHLLPRARAWFLTPSKALRQFFVGLSSWPEDVKQFYDGIFGDIFPQTTRELDEWEDQFGLPDIAGMTEQERRDRLAGAWSATGGQSPAYLQGVLQAAGFNVFIHEWWEPIPDRSGGSVFEEISFLITEEGDFLITEEGDFLVSAGTIQPVVRNPFEVLASGAVVYIMNDGGEDAQDGDPAAMDGATSGSTGYPLVNKPEFTAPVIPADPAAWRYFLYIGGETYPEHANVPTARRAEFEALCLKICPAQQWLGMLIDYT